MLRISSLSALSKAAVCDTSRFNALAISTVELAV